MTRGNWPAVPAHVTLAGHMTIRLVALDLDGTLLDPRGDLRDDVREAVGALRRAQLRVVVCTGRRFRTALPVLERLRALRRRDIG